MTFLGAPQLACSGRAITATSMKAIGLLAYLGAHDRPQRREHLLALLWPESPIAQARKNLRNVLLPLADHLLLRKRALIETIFDQLKKVCQIGHSRHCSPINFCVRLLAGLVAYCHQPKKPSLGLDLHRRIAASLIPNWRWRSN